jgi:hypothetical protein
MFFCRKKKDLTGIQEDYSVKSPKSQEERTWIRERITQIITDLIVIGIVFAIYACVYTLVDPKIAYFSCHESGEINFPFKSNTIEFWVVCVYGIVGPFLFILLVEFKNAKFLFSRVEKKFVAKLKYFLVNAFHAISLFALGLAVTFLLTEIGKKWVGRLRPYFLTVCKPRLSRIDCLAQTFSGVIFNSIYTGGSFCTGDKAAIKEARFSWPSGHSSTAW